MTDQASCPLQKPNDPEEGVDRKRTIMLQVNNIAIVAAAPETTGMQMKQENRPPDAVLARRLNGLAMLLTGHVALIDAEAAGARSIWHGSPTAGLPGNRGRHCSF